MLVYTGCQRVNTKFSTDFKMKCRIIVYKHAHGNPLLKDMI